MPKPAGRWPISRDRPKPIGLIDLVDSLPEEMRHAIIEETVSQYRKYLAAERRKQRTLKPKKHSP
jgi:hypothetical protein